VANRDGLRDHQPHLPASQPSPPGRPAARPRAIEALHHLRDTTFAEDGSQVRTGVAPNVMACLRNPVIGVLSRAGPVNVAAALRRHARDPRRPLATLGISLGCTPTSRQNAGAWRVEGPIRARVTSCGSPVPHDYAATSSILKPRPSSSKLATNQSRPPPSAATAT
jgi:hypothetical protein